MPLMTAIWNACRPCWRLEPIRTEAKGTLALYVAVNGGHSAIAKTLLEADADPKRHAPSQLRVDNQTKTFGEEASPLYLAVENKNKEIAQLLLDHGADPNITNPQGSPAVQDVRHLILLFDAKLADHAGRAATLLLVSIVRTDTF